MFKQIQISTEVISEMNRRDYWAVAHRRHKMQKQSVHYHLMMHNIAKRLPVKITMTRCSPRRLDDDNLVSAFKYVRDAISEYLVSGEKELAPGRADDDPRLNWVYSQEKCRQKGVKVSFEWPES